MKVTVCAVFAALALVPIRLPARDTSSSAENSPGMSQPDSQRFYQQTQAGQYHRVTQNPADASHQSFHASDIIGLDVRNMSGDKVGGVEDLIVDLPNGSVSYAVISTGGVLGLGSKLVAVPINRLSYTSGDKDLLLNVDRQTLAAAPTFTRNHEPKWGNSAWTAQVDRYYRDNSQMTPTGRSENTVGNPARRTEATRETATASATASATATAPETVPQNIEPPRSMEFTPSPTAGDKSDTKDLRISEDIRKGFRDDGTLSHGASNVQVSTHNGQVTLTGTAATEEERQQLVNRAKMIAKTSQVVCHIDVAGSERNNLRDSTK